MAWKTSSIFSMTRGLRLSNLWMASRTNSSTSAAAASLVSLRNSISCQHSSGSVKIATITSFLHSVGHPVFWYSLQTQWTAHHRDDVGCHVREAHAAWVESAHQQLPVLISVFVFCDVVRLDHLLFQNDHQLRGGERKKKTTCVRFTALLLFSRQQGISADWPPPHCETKQGPAPAAKSSSWLQGRECWEHAGCPSQGPGQRKDQSRGWK